MKRTFRELIKPYGEYSMRRFVALVCVLLLAVYTGFYIYDPSLYDPSVISVISGAASISAASAAVKKYDEPFNKLDPRSYDKTLP